MCVLALLVSALIFISIMTVICLYVANDNRRSKKRFGKTCGNEPWFD